MINYVIIDDEPSAIEVLQIHLNKIPSFSLKATFRDPIEGLEYLQENEVDLIFLDINMPKLSGLSFPKFLQKPPLIIFTTAYSEYALKSYELKAIDYLLKPIEFDRLLQATMKVQDTLNQNRGAKKSDSEVPSDSTEQTIFIKSGSEFHQLAIKNIKHIESEGNYVTFHSDKSPILARYKLSEVLDLLPPNQFVKIHRSNVVALKHIETVKSYCVVINGKEIPISSKYREEFFDLINRLAGKSDI
ncbi:response regulator transcription factor [Algoriphagus sp. SE2]|uniref:LytR/AlgR family response regulator transcription factor n=1 Tax=Algoriphagus sp. SE2 TaxID=3141536 RepID=UPI0031CD50E0